MIIIVIIIIIFFLSTWLEKMTTQCEAGSKGRLFSSRFLQGIFSMLSECEVLPSKLLTEFWKIGQEVLIAGDI